MHGNGDIPGGSRPRGAVEVFQHNVPRASERALTLWEGYHPAEEVEQESGVNLLEIWRIIYKHKWVIAATVVASLALGFTLTALTQPIYTATATLKIDREADNSVGLRDVQQFGRIGRDPEFFQTQYGLLKSRSLAKRVAQSLGLAADDSFFRQMGVLKAGSSMPNGPNAAPRREKMATGILEGHLGVFPVRDSQLVKLSFDSPDPQLSARIANAFADNFIESNLDRRFEASAYARKFLEDHIAQLKTKLEDSERQLVAYATQQQIIQVAEPAQGRDAAPPQSLDATNLGAFDAALTAAKAERIKAQERWRAAQNVDLGAPEVLADPTVQSLRQERAKLQGEYQDQLKTYKPDYPDMLQLKSRIDEVERQLKTAAETIRTSLKTQYVAAQQQENALQGNVNHLKGSVLDTRNREIKYNILQREVDTNRTLYDGLLQRYKEIGVAGGITTNNISIVDRADPPGGPSKPQPIHNLTMAGMTGLGLGLLFAFLLETMDQAIRKPADVEAKLGLPVLGAVPLLQKGVQPIEALGDPRSPFAEAYYSIRSALQFSTKEGAPRVLTITSARPEEGKSTSAIALAQSFARLGLRTLLMDLDLRNPSLHKAIGADNRSGVSNLLTGALGLAEAVQPTMWPNLFVVPSGPIPPSPAELLAGPRLKALVDDAAEQFDIVVLDAPPVMGLADAPLISWVATGAILAIEAGRTSRAQARAAIRRLRMANARLLGVVLTKFDARQATYGYGYSYTYEYDYKYGAQRRGESGDSGSRALTREQARQTPPAA